MDIIVKNVAIDVKKIDAKFPIFYFIQYSTKIMNNIDDISNTNICKKNIVKIGGFCNNHICMSIEKTYLCKNCGEIRCGSCIKLDGEKCIGCIKSNKDIISSKCRNCGGVIWLRLCVICAKPIYYCTMHCWEYKKINVLIEYNHHYCVTCYQS